MASLSKTGECVCSLRRRSSLVSLSSSLVSLSSFLCFARPLYLPVIVPVPSWWCIANPIILSNRTYHLRNYRKCFIGSEAVRWFLSPASGLNLSTREEAVAYGKLLADKQFFHHVTNDHHFEDARLFYRFIGDDEKTTLNTDHGTNAGKTVASCTHVYVVSGCDPKPATEVAEKVRKLILALYDEFLSPDGRYVDYDGLAKSDGWKRYLQKVAELQRVDVSVLTRNEKVIIPNNKAH